MKLIISLLLLGKELSAQTNHVSYTRPNAPMALVYDSGDASFDAALGNKVIEIPITDRMSFSMDITVNSLYYRPGGGWPSVPAFECNGDEIKGWVSLPRIALIDAASEEFEGFATVVGSSHDNKDGQQQTLPVVEGQTYHLDVEFTQSSLKVSQDGVVTYETDDLPAHDVSDSLGCYVGSWDGGRPSADVTVSNIVIRSECADGYEFIDGVCYATCPIGYTGSLDKCTSDAPMSIVYDSEDETFESARGNKITDIPITDSMSFSMDISVNSFYYRPGGGWAEAAAFECNSDELKGWVKLPRIALIDAGEYGDERDGFATVVGSSHDNKGGQQQTAPVEEGKTYHLDVIFTQSSLVILQDNVVTFDTDDFKAHEVFDSIGCYVGSWNGGRPSADVTVSNIVIRTDAKYDFVSDKSCEYYGMDRIKDPNVCQHAASQLAGTNGIREDYKFFDRDTWTLHGRPNGCSYHRFGNIEQWYHEHEEPCNVVAPGGSTGFAGCLCTKPAIEKTEQWVDVRKYELLDDTPRTWDEAQSACQETFGTDLASIHNIADFDAAYELCQSKGGDAHCYIGLRRGSDDETSWKWSDGSTVDYGSDFSGGVFPWSQGEPNYLKISGIGRPNEDCAEMVIPNDGEWNDIPCDGRLYALCNAVGSSYEVFKTNTAIELFHNADSGLEVDAELRQQLVGSHCSHESSSNFGLIIGDLEDHKWHKIRYTIEFVSGSSACWSLFGDTHYGPFEDNDDFGLTTLNVIENGLTVGEWNGEKKLCNNEKSNFMHSSNGVGNKGYLIVEQDRDLSVDVAGISAGFSCISAGQVVSVKDISVAYWTDQWVGVRKYELLTDTKRTWSEAQAACQETFGTDLASLHSKSDYDMAYEICQSEGADCWIGLHRNSEDASGWQWSDGSTVDFGSDFSGSVFPWADGEPNNANRAGEECVEMRLYDSFEWNDSLCGVPQYALCNPL